MARPVPLVTKKEALKAFQRAFPDAQISTSSVSVKLYQTTENGDEYAKLETPIFLKIGTELHRLYRILDKTNERVKRAQAKE
jgi:hypothetical protein